MRRPWNLVFVVFTTMILVVVGKTNTIIGLVFQTIYSIFLYLLFLNHRKSDGLGFAYLWYLVIIVPVLLLISDLITDSMLSFWGLVVSVVILIGFRAIHLYLGRCNQDLYKRTFGKAGEWALPLDKVLFGGETERKL